MMFIVVSFPSTGAMASCSKHVFEFARHAYQWERRTFRSKMVLPKA